MFVEVVTVPRGPLPSTTSHSILNNLTSDGYELIDPPVLVSADKVVIDAGYRDRHFTFNGDKIDTTFKVMNFEIQLECVNKIIDNVGKCFSLVIPKRVG